MKIGQGHVYHSRQETTRHSFRYPTFFFLFRCDQQSELAALCKQRFARIFSIDSKSYLHGRPGSLKSNVDTFLLENCGYSAEEVWLHTLPRMFGYAFNPVSFWLCKRAGKLEAVLVEVNNTFHERHFYWLKPPNGIGQDWIRAEKVMHVSPFFPTDGYYQFRFLINSDEARIDINYHAADGKLRLATWVRGELSPLAQHGPVQLLAKYGWMTPLVVMRIHLHALRLLIKKVRFFRKPQLPHQEVTS